jgi:hypothetical protein
MKYLAAALTLLIAFAAAGASADAASFVVSSSSFSASGTLSAKFAFDQNNCGGQNVSPAVPWSNAPATTKSFAIVMFDVDGQRGLGVVHWVAYAIAPGTTSLAEGMGNKGGALVSGTVMPGIVTYRGACPPAGDSPHHYILSVFALDLDPNAYAGGMTRDELLAAIKGHILAESSVIAIYAR